MNYKDNYYKHHNLDKCDVLYCVMCGRVAENLHHIKYKSQGGSDKPENLAPMCFACHDGHHYMNVPTAEQIKIALIK